MERILSLDYQRLYFTQVSAARYARYITFSLFRSSIRKRHLAGVSAEKFEKHYILEPGPDGEDFGKIWSVI